MIRVLHVAEATIGGTRKHLVQLASGLDRGRFQVAVACAVERDPHFREDLDTLDRQGVEIVEIPMQRELGMQPDREALRELRTFLETNPFDVVHTHSSKAGALGRWAAIQTGHRGIVHTPHSFAFLHNREFSVLKRRAFLGVERHLGRKTTRLIAVSESEARATRDNDIIDPARIRVVHNGVDVDAEIEAAGGAQPHRARTDRREIGTAGLLELSKGHDDLIAAVELVKEGVPEIHCTIIGEGSRRRELEQLRDSAGLGTAVALPGHLEADLEVIAGFELFVLPSLWEGLPYVLLEAMSLGLPVIASEVGGCPEVVEAGVTGLLVPPQRPDRLAEAIESLLGDPSVAREMGMKGQQRARRDFSLDQMIRDTESVYDEVVAEIRTQAGPVDSPQ